MKVINHTLDFHPSGQLIDDITRFYILHDRNDLTGHCRSVAEIAVKLAAQFGLDETKASISGWSHDLGRVVPDAQMIDYCTKENIDVLDEEKKAPGILHQKVSRNIAQKVFGIVDTEILEAIEVHTTLRNNVGELSLLLFLADKLSWEDRYKKGFIDNVNAGLEISLNNGACAYLQYMFECQEKLDVVHPWMLEAYHDLCKREGKMRIYIAIKYYADYRNENIIDKISSTFEKIGHETVCVIRDDEKKGKKKLNAVDLMKIACNRIDSCNMVIIDLSEKGVGIGIEAGYAYAKNIPIVTIARKGSDISKTLRGISKAVYFYKELADIEEGIKIIMNSIKDGEAPSLLSES